MGMINHINYMDQDGHIYCCLRNKVVKLDEQQKEKFCKGCSMFAGTAEGKGVECLWEDARTANDPWIADDPRREFLKNQIRHVGGHYVSSIIGFCG
ncbi:hypothetical protein N0M98_32200 [Paenibacillus doosanensis]|uniref:4Fe4S-binding SPASM domain-containing protein n=1 Tax=Paenibacillus konkukensis TaxID=2020716 RepID=A0ABY4RNJ4_9BACL|nr:MULTISPECIES: hypothetical protein [Paenibacillus]MCS7464750.1 hypothetical protein [Paenibacillus doosanensis]UQZ83745.1 hypothetical protein SK3146_02952 [Paenibacillus konkukensis]